MKAEMSDDDGKVFGGKENYTMEVESYLCKLKINSAQVKDFACTREGTVLVMGLDETPKLSIIPDKPTATGLTHFYKENGEWKFVSSDDYEAKKESLPHLCFATK